jgi:hypothetical protein
VDLIIRSSCPQSSRVAAAQGCRPVSEQVYDAGQVSSRALRGRIPAYTFCGSVNKGGTCTNRFRFREDLAREDLVRQIGEKILSPEAIEGLKHFLQETGAEKLSDDQVERTQLIARIADHRRRISSTMDTIVAAKKRNDGTDGLWYERLAQENRDLHAMPARQKELESSPEWNMDELVKALDAAVEEQKAGLVDVERPERVRESIRLMAGTIAANP